MTQSLWPQLRLDADTKAEKAALYRQVYLDTYVWDEHQQRRIFTDWTGCTYQFSPRAFDHAFTEAKNYKTSAGIHDGGWSWKRLRRLLWIKEVLALNGCTVERYAQSKLTDRGRRAKRRTLVVVEESYVVVFDDPKEKGQPHQFVTAFPTDANYLANIRKNSFLVETKTAGKKKPQS